MADEDKKGHEVIYDPNQNKEDWTFSDLDGNVQTPLTEEQTNELFPSVFIKAGNKTVEIYHEKMGSLWACRFAEGGELPRALKSKFTSPEDAKLQVEIYKANLETE